MKVHLKTRAFDTTVNVNGAAIKVFAGILVILAILMLFVKSESALTCFICIFVGTVLLALGLLFTPFHYEVVDENTETQETSKHDKVKATTTKEKPMNKVPLPQPVEKPKEEANKSLVEIHDASVSNADAPMDDSAWDNMVQKSASTSIPVFNESSQEINEEESANDIDMSEIESLLKSLREADDQI